MEGTTNNNEPETPQQEPIVHVPLVDHAGGEWQKWRQFIEQNMAVATVEMKQHYNVWDHMADVISVLNKMQSGEWEWYRNSRCKYIEVRIDMRSGNCIIFDGERKRINPSDLAHQVT